MTDQELEHDLTVELLNDDRLSLHPIGVTVKEGVVTLEGCVQSYRRKLLVHEIVAGHVGVRDLLDRLVVEPPLPATDAEVADRVRAALDASADVTKSSVTVEVRGGKATLRGNAVDPWERIVAEDIALSVRGVRAVHNLLVINAPQKKEDEELSQAIKSAFGRSYALSQSRIQVAVSHNFAVLSGEAPSFAQKRLATVVAQRFDVTGVRNDIVVVDRSSEP